MRFFFSLFKPKKPKKKEDPMSEVQQHLARIDEVFKLASFDLAEIAFKIIRCPEIASKISHAEGEMLVNAGFRDVANFENLAKNTVALVQQRPLGN